MADRPAIHAYLAGLIDKIFKLAYMQQFIIGVVAALGVVTALLISVLQRQRELGLLRGWGHSASSVANGPGGSYLDRNPWYHSRRHARHTDGVVSLGILLFEESGFNFRMIIPWQEAMGIGLIAVGVATIAGLIPAIRAVRLRITEAIAYE